MRRLRRHSRQANARSLAGVFILVALTLWLGGCATPPQTRSLSGLPASRLPPTIELRDVPYFPQDAYQCGPSTLAMTMNAAGLDTNPETLTPQVYLPGREGSLQVEMLSTTRRHGLLAYTLRPQLQDVLAEVAAGHPVLVLQNLAFNWWPRWHYAVVIGYDLEKRIVILRSGPEPRQQLSLSTFEHTWARSGHWAILTLPPDQIPVTATPENFLNAALALEQTRQPAAALRAYRSATQRWPDLFAAYIGLGNTAYQLGDFAAAAAAFRDATRLQPAAAIAHNNLADTLLRQNRLDEALTHAQIAVAVGGDREPAFAQTLAEIQAQITLRQNRLQPNIKPEP